MPPVYSSPTQPSQMFDLSSLRNLLQQQIESARSSMFGGALPSWVPRQGTAAGAVGARPPAPPAAPRNVITPEQWRQMMAGAPLHAVGQMFQPGGQVPAQAFTPNVSPLAPRPAPVEAPAAPVSAPAAPVAPAAVPSPIAPVAQGALGGDLITQVPYGAATGLSARPDLLETTIAGSGLGLASPLLLPRREV